VKRQSLSATTQRDYISAVIIDISPGNVRCWSQLRLSWAYELRLIVPRSSKLPDRVPKEKWLLAARHQSFPKIVADGINRSGFSITKPRAPATPSAKVVKCRLA
jgi:hypothetical protein